MEILFDDWEEQMNKAEKYDQIYNKFIFYDKIKNSLNFFGIGKEKEKEIYLFVASVLKKGFYWNKNF